MTQDSTTPRRMVGLAHSPHDPSKPWRWEVEVPWGGARKWVDGWAGTEQDAVTAASDRVALERKVDDVFAASQLIRELSEALDAAETDAQIAKTIAPYFKPQQMDAASIRAV